MKYTVSIHKKNAVMVFEFEHKHNAINFIEYVSDAKGVTEINYSVDEEEE